ncbi:hypothetical protein HDU98_008149 [Podochytrium sp. JEL0797]|nr:hypothetical protein HDU98_008149 [Podochytrium sp. JEL0797]
MTKSWLSSLPSLASPTATTLVAARSNHSECDAVLCDVGTNKSTLRLLSLAKLKKSANEAAVQHLSPSVHFTVTTLELNSTGTLLALAGQFHVAVAVLPPALKYANTSANVPMNREIKIHTIGDLYHANETSRVVKVAWHPMSAESSHLMVLTADGCLRMYDVGTDPDEPEQTAWFSDQSEFLPTSFKTSSTTPSPAKRKGGVFGIDLDEREAVSFAISGSKREHENEYVGNEEEVFRGWNPLTVYGLMKSGDVYAVCPFVPFKSIWTLASLTHLHALTTHEWKSCKEDDAHTEKQFYWRSRWLQECIDSATQYSATQLPIDRVRFNVSRNLLNKLKPVRQGPVLVLGGDDEEEGVKFARDLVAVEVGAGVAFLSLFEGGRVEVWVEVEGAVAKWEVAEEELVPTCPSFYLYERLHLTPQSKGSPSPVTPPSETSLVKMYRDPNYADTLFVAHAERVYLVSLRAWMSKFSKTKDLAKWFDPAQHVASEVQCLVDVLSVDSTVHEEVSSFGVIGDVLLGYCFLLTTTQNQLLGRSLALRPSSSMTPRTTHPSSTKPIESTLQITPYTPTITSDFEIPLVLTKQSPLVVSKSSESTPLSDESFLRTMGTKIASIRTDIASIQQAGRTVQHRVEDVQSESIRQHTLVHTYADVVEGPLAERTAEIVARVDTVRGKLEGLEERVDAVLQLLMDEAAPRLSRAEEAFMEEVERQKTMLLKQMQEVEQKYPRALHRANETVLGATQIKRMDEALSFEYKLLTETWKKVETVRDALA